MSDSSNSRSFRLDQSEPQRLNFHGQLDHRSAVRIPLLRELGPDLDRPFGGGRLSWPNHLTKLSSETYRHFIAKACLFYLLRKMKHDVSSEWKVPNGYVDLCDKTTRTFYEIEFHPSPKFRSRKIDLYRVTGYEVIVIDCSRMPPEMEGMKEYLEEFIIPD